MNPMRSERPSAGAKPALLVSIIALQRVLDIENPTSQARVFDLRRGSRQGPNGHHDGRLARSVAFRSAISRRRRSRSRWASRE